MSVKETDIGLMISEHKDLTERCTMLQASLKEPLENIEKEEIIAELEEVVQKLTISHTLLGKEGVAFLQGLTKNKLNPITSGPGLASSKSTSKIKPMGS
jgi:hypothetical protein